MNCACREYRYFENHGVEIVGYEIPQLFGVHAANTDEIGDVPLGDNSRFDRSVSLS